MLVAENMSKEEMVKEAVEEAKAKAAKEAGEQEVQTCLLYTSTDQKHCIHVTGQKQV